MSVSVGGLKYRIIRSYGYLADLLHGYIKFVIAAWHLLHLWDSSTLTVLALQVQ